MANLQQPLGLKTLFLDNAASSATCLSDQETKNQKIAMAAQLILELNNPHSREKALTEFSENRELRQLPDLAPMLWHSFGTVAALLQEIISIYPMLSPPNLTHSASNRVCCVLALLQCLASHPDIRTHFVIVNTTSQEKPFDDLRITSLGVLGALVKVATFIVQKILRDDVGLAYMCATAQRFYAVSQALRSMILEKPSVRLLRHIIRCYLRLSDNSRACDALKSCLPDILRDMEFLNCLQLGNGYQEHAC